MIEENLTERILSLEGIFKKLLENPPTSTDGNPFCINDNNPFSDKLIYRNNYYSCNQNRLIIGQNSEFSGIYNSFYSFYSGFHREFSVEISHANFFQRKLFKKDINFKLRIYLLNGSRKFDGLSYYHTNKLLIDLNLNDSNLTSLGKIITETVDKSKNFSGYINYDKFKLVNGFEPALDFFENSEAFVKDLDNKYLEHLTIERQKRDDERNRLIWYNL